MKRRYYSFYDIFLNDLNIGNVTVAYHDNPVDLAFPSYVSVEIYFNRILAQVDGLILSSQNWQFYKEEIIETQDSSQAENMALGLIKGIILNHTQYNITLTMRRQAFRIISNILNQNLKLNLIHEFYSEPMFKQVSIFPIDQIRQFSINDRDEYIVDYIEQEFLGYK